MLAKNKLLFSGVLMMTLLFCSSCISFIPADGGLTIEGFLKTYDLIDSKSVSDCRIALHKVGRNDFGFDYSRQLNINKGHFVKSFTISPAGGTFYMTFKCSGTEKEFKTQNYEVKSGTQYNEHNPLDIGIITLQDN